MLETMSTSVDFDAIDKNAPVAYTDKPEIAVSVVNVRKEFGAAVALKDITLNIRDREFFTLLGPSGCGKTTLLRIIAGFENVSQGSVLLHGRQIADLPANQRPVNTVFQHYSLFPHMSVADNILFGLQMRKVPAAKARRRVECMLELVQLSELAHRLPSQLSGGQQQRVALARALAPEPEVLLLDEPLSALDLKLRQAMRVELKQIQEQSGITFIFVTHDQEEALTLSDRIAVMSSGEVQQVGSARDIYETPTNRFVADFIGETNLLEAEILHTDEELALCVMSGGGRVMAELPRALKDSPEGSRGYLSIRPEKLSIVRAPIASQNLLSGIVQRQIYLGTDTQLVVRLADGQDVIMRSQNTEVHGTMPSQGETVYLSVERGAALFLGQ